MERFKRESARWLGATAALSTLALLLATMPGCQGGGEGTVAPTKGKVTYEGQPVNGGTISLRPTDKAEGVSEGKMGKPASGGVQSDGTFTLSTYKTGDGALVGTHEVTYTAPRQGAESYEDKPEKSQYEGLVPKEKTITIKSGQNDLTIELVPSGNVPAVGGATPPEEKPAEGGDKPAE